MSLSRDGTLKGTADGTPINFGYYTGDEFFKVEYPAGPGCWEVWARVDKDGYIEGMISVGGGQGLPQSGLWQKSRSVNIRVPPVR